MQALKIITIAFNILFALIVLWFCKPLSWRKEEDRFSIVGFGSMIVLYFLNTVLIWQ